MTAPATTSQAAADLVRAGRRVVAAGLSPGASGNLSVRDGDRFLMSPTGTPLDELDVDGLAVVDLRGRHLTGPPPSKEVSLHLAMYRRDPRAGAVVHVHSPQAVAVSCLEPWSRTSALPPLTPYFVMRVGQVPAVPYAPPGDPAQAVLVETLDVPSRAVLLQNHGPVLASADLGSAVEMAVELEEASRLTLLLAGRGRELTADQVADLSARYGSPWSASAGPS